MHEAERVGKKQKNRMNILERVLYRGQWGSLYRGQWGSLSFHPAGPNEGPGSVDRLWQGLWQATRTERRSQGAHVGQGVVKIALQDFLGAALGFCQVKSNESMRFLCRDGSRKH